MNGKYAILVTLTALLLLSAGGAGLAAETTGDPPLPVAVEAKFEFPPVVEGTEIVHDFTIRNTGGSELTIEKIRTG